MIDHPQAGYHGGGGTGLIFRDSLHVKMVDVGGKDSFEFSEWLVSCLGCSWRLLIVCHPPYFTEHNVTVSVFLREFSDYLKLFVLSKEQILIASDFNIHVDDTRNVDAVTFLDVLKSFGLHQHVKQPTRFWQYISLLNVNLQRPLLYTFSKHFTNMLMSKAEQYLMRIPQLTISRNTPKLKKYQVLWLHLTSK